MWGCLLAAAITFPLVWGWIHFETVPGHLDTYRTFVFGFAAGDFPVDSIPAFIVFHGLVWASFLVLAGVMLAFRRRMIDRGAEAVQQFGEDILPLVLLAAISVSGLMLTVSYTWLRGYAYDFLAILHAVTVIVTMLWLPFGKLFHVFQRPAQLGVSFYKDAGARGEQARCRRCERPFASAHGPRPHHRRARARLSLRDERRGRRTTKQICPPAGARCSASRRAPSGRRPRPRISMAKLPVDDLAITRAFGPHLSEGIARHRSSAGQARQDPLLLLRSAVRHPAQGRGNEVIGFEPWDDFPFNRGMLCPKGVKRYLQGSHPDRLLTALRRDPSAPAAFARWVTTPRSRVASEIARLQKEHGNGAIGVLGGASLTTEKTYLLGKFARVCLKTPFIDYNGRLCMVSAGAANKKAFGIDRTTNPWSDMVGTEVIWVAGSNVAECSPITTNYIWQAREMGAKVIVQDPRITPIARTCDLYLPVRPGRDAALFAGVLGLMIEQGWIDREFIEEHTTGFEQGGRLLQAVDAARTAEVTGVPERSIRKAAELVGARPSRASCCTRAGSSTTRTACRTSLGTINLVLATGRIGKPKCGYGTIVGQANGQGGREHGQKCDQLPGWRDISNPEHRKYIADVWGSRRRTCRAPASTRTSCSARSTRARSRD
jgi:anaerobic selenocysteine-containing dehydrogenase